MKPTSSLFDYHNDEDRQLARIASNLIWVAWGTYVFVIFAGFYFDDLRMSAVMLVSCLLLIIPFVLLRAGRVRISTWFVVLSSIVTITLISIVGQGIRSVAIVAFPIAFIFAGLSLNRTLFHLSVVLALMGVCFLAFGDVYGWYTPTALQGESATWYLLIVVIVMQLVAALAVDMLANGLRASLERARQEIIERKQAEEALKYSEQKYRAIIESSPVPSAIDDGQHNVTLLNSAFVRTFGYTVDDIPTNDEWWLRAYPDPDYRQSVIATWQERLDRAKRDQTAMEPMEVRVRCKDGSTRNVIVSASSLVDAASEIHLITLYDITGRIQEENIIRARLRISQFAEDHHLREVLQHATDELCALTDSPIGFFHFVEPDQNTLTLQAWSTYTLKEMCTASGTDQHYNLAEAGVWADCARLGRPIMHNDYASLPNRRGMPEGHARVTREMIFPIWRDEKIVAILGVGNKAQDYIDSDVLYATQLADMIWDIAERKRAEEVADEQRALVDALSNSAAALNSTLKFSEVLDRIFSNVERVVPHELAEVYLLDEEARTARIVGYHYTNGSLLDLMGLAFEVEQVRDLREMQHTGEPVNIPDTSTFAGWVATPYNQWIRSSLGAPIKARGKVIGFVCLSSATPNSFSPKDAQRLHTFVNYAAIAIENARLYEEVQKLALVDTLTGVFNRTFFEAELARIEPGRDFPVSIVVADLDNMKVTNDTLRASRRGCTVKAHRAGAASRLPRLRYHRAHWRR